MRCPDCGNNLTELSIDKQRMVRCFRCGGFWLDSDTANGITAEQVRQWRRISSMNPSWGWKNQGACPADGMKLGKYTGDLIPPNLDVKRCLRCGMWWFPKDSLFEYKPASEAKLEYLKRWGIMADVKNLLLPSLLVISLLVTIMSGLNLVKKQQQFSVGASGNVKNFSVTTTGLGKAVVVFKDDKKIGEISYQRVGDTFIQAVPVKIYSGYYVSTLTGLIPGEEYSIQVSGKMFKFTAH